jgi:hypothetical protein
MEGEEVEGGGGTSESARNTPTEPPETGAGYNQALLHPIEQAMRAHRCCLR